MEKFLEVAMEDMVSVHIADWKFAREMNRVLDLWMSIDLFDQTWLTGLKSKLISKFKLH